jgi:hypothetical protein
MKTPAAPGLGLAASAPDGRNSGEFRYGRASISVTFRVFSSTA